MKTRSVSVLVGVAIAAVVLTGSLVAVSSRSSLDQQFLARARDSAPASVSDDALVAVGRDTCRGFRDGELLTDVLTREMRAGLAPAQAAEVTRAAIDVYCPDVGKILLTPVDTPSTTG